MPLITTTVSSPIAESFRVAQVRGLFDLPPSNQSGETFTAQLPEPEEAWTIGAIVGPSGSGKTTIARQVFGSALQTHSDWPRDRAMIDGFGDVPMKRLARVLTAVGLGSPPVWLRPYHVLSNGEQFRCQLARAVIGSEQTGDGPDRLVVFDEFTSVVDRTVARSASAALGKLLRRQGSVAAESADQNLLPPLRFIAVTCHYDILDWLAPDWHLDMATGKLARGGLQRPYMRLAVRRSPQALWSLFARHHYLSGSLARSASCYVAFWDDRPVAFCATVGQLGHRGWKRISRLVTLPDYQGLGIGMKFVQRVCQAEVARGFRISITTSHPAVIASCSASPLWRLRRVKQLGGTR